MAGGLEAKAHWAPVQGPSTSTGRGAGAMGCWVDGRGCKDVRVVGGWQGVVVVFAGVTGEVGGVRGIGGGRWTGSPSILGTSQGSQHCHWHGCRVSEGHLVAGRQCRGALGAGRWYQDGHWGGRWTGSQTTLGTSPGKQHFHWQGCRVSEGNQVACQVFRRHWG